MQRGGLGDAKRGVWVMQRGFWGGHDAAWRGCMGSEEWAAPPQMPHQGDAEQRKHSGGAGAARRTPRAGAKAGGDTPPPADTPILGTPDPQGTPVPMAPIPTAG